MRKDLKKVTKASTHNSSSFGSIDFFFWYIEEKLKHNFT